MGNAIKGDTFLIGDPVESDKTTSIYNVSTV